jgi:hypothetical protein
MSKENVASVYDNPLWKSFYIPKDKITTRFIEILNRYTNLPATFYYDKDIKQSFGLPLLELKKEYVRQIKNIPSLSRLERGDYQTDKSKSDYKIVKDIKFFTNNLPSFQKYQGQDDLTFLIQNHRLLILEILERYSDDTSLKTIEGRIVALLRIFYIAYGIKTYELYQKYSILMLDLLFQFRQEEDNQQLNPREENAYIPFEVIIDFQQQLLKDFQTNPTYERNQNLLLVSLYRYLPERNELKLLSFTNEYKEDKDYIYFNKDNDVMLLLNLVKKRHNALHINLSKDFPILADIIKLSYQFYPRINVFTDYKDIKKPISVHGLSKRLTKIFSFTGKNAGVNSIRSSYLTYQSEQKRLSVADKKKLATLMRTRKDKIDANYIKILPQSDKKELIDEINQHKISTTKRVANTYEKKLLQNKEYYNKNKEVIIERVKQNYQQQNKRDLARKKILYYLNNDENYKNKIKKETIDKYNIVLNNKLYQ